MQSAPMKILVIGSGDVGGPVAEALIAKKHEVLRASRSVSDFRLRVDLGTPESIRSLFKSVGKIDAVVSCAGLAKPGPFTKLKDDDFEFTLGNKVMGQVNLVRFGLDSVRDNGVFILTAGVYSQKPPAGVTAFALANGAVESFGRAAALDMPRGIRINVISPPWLAESAAKAGQKAPVTGVQNAQFYVDAIEGTQTGQVIYPS